MGVTPKLPRDRVVATAETHDGFAEAEVETGRCGRQEAI